MCLNAFLNLKYTIQNSISTLVTISSFDLCLKIPFSNIYQMWYNCLDNAYYSCSQLEQDEGKNKVFLPTVFQIMVLYISHVQHHHWKCFLLFSQSRAQFIKSSNVQLRVKPHLET